MPYLHGIGSRGATLLDYLPEHLQLFTYGVVILGVLYACLIRYSYKAEQMIDTLPIEDVRIRLKGETLLEFDRAVEFIKKKYIDDPEPLWKYNHTKFEIYCINGELSAL